MLQYSSYEQCHPKQNHHGKIHGFGSDIGLRGYCRGLRILGLGVQGLVVYHLHHFGECWAWDPKVLNETTEARPKSGNVRFLFRSGEQLPADQGGVR